MGYFEYGCDCRSVCTYICKTCGSRSCSSCGKKTTDQWIEDQRETLPDIEWQHVTFTMPDELWPVFMANRKLQSALFKLATKGILKKAKKKSITVGIFAVIHTAGRDLKGNVHIHLSVTFGGSTKENT